MFRLRYCVNDAKSRKIRRLTKFVFKRTDLVKEGEHWVGGLMSLVLLVFIVMGCWFTGNFIAQYPYESAPNPSFACAPVYNAKFSSSMQSVALPPDEVAAPMYALLAEQPLTLQLDVLNTNISCDDASAAVVTAVTTALPFTCSSPAPATLTLLAALPEHTTTVQWTLKGPQLIGGLRLGIQGPATTADDGGNSYALRQVGAAQSLSMAQLTLQKAVTLPISLTKVVNTTAPLSSGGAMLVTGLWIPVFPAASDAMFQSQQEYLASEAGPFLLEVDVTETAFWVLNEQEPIARSAEAAFKTLLYIIMLLEVAALAFLVFKLLQPLVHCAALKWRRRSVKKVWDRDDSSDEEDWLEDVWFGERVKALNASGNAGVRELTEALRTERTRARQERREAREGKTPRDGEASARNSARAVQPTMELQLNDAPRSSLPSSVPLAGDAPDSEQMQETDVV